MSFDIDGKIHKIFETEQKTQTFQAREFVLLVEDGQYPQFIKFQLTQDRCGLVDAYKEGDNVKVHFDLRGREWNDKYFTNLNAWRLESLQTDAGAPASDNSSGVDDIFPPGPEGTEKSEAGGQPEDFDDLPF